MTRCAVVAGGSLAGLCAAGALAERFERVVLVDRDAFPDGPEDRAGVPQARHIHVLLARGRREIERLFPGFDAAMRAAGALELDFSWDIAALRPAGWAPRERGSPPTFSSSRRLLEWVIREQLRRRPNVELVEGTAVAGLECAPEPRVTAVRLQPRGASPTRLEVDLFVDACGRSSKSPEWLERFGLPRPRETVVDSFAGYSPAGTAVPPSGRRAGGGAAPGSTRSCPTIPPQGCCSRARTTSGPSPSRPRDGAIHPATRRASPRG